MSFQSGFVACFIHCLWRPSDFAVVKHISHGGASCVLAEQAGSMAANLFLNRDTHVALGLDINANHLKAARKGYVFAKAIPIHIGARTQVWEIKITDEKNELTCISRLTMAVIPVSPDTQRKQELIS